MSEERDGPDVGPNSEPDDEGAEDPIEALPLRLQRLVRFVSAAFVILFALVLASAITGPILRVVVSLGLVADGSSVWQALRTVIQFGGFLLAVIIYLSITDQWDLLQVTRPTTSDGFLVVLVAIGLLMLQYGALFVLSTAGVSTGQNRATVPSGDPVGYFVLMIVVSLVIVGPIEELLFRGVVQGGLRRAFGAVPAILVASVLFGLVHLPAIAGTYAEQTAYVLIVVGLGCVLGYLYERTENVIVPGLAHGAYNAAIYGVLLWGVL